LSCKAAVGATVLVACVMSCVFGCMPMFLRTLSASQRQPPSRNTPAEEHMSVPLKRRCHLNASRGSLAQVAAADGSASAWAIGLNMWLLSWAAARMILWCKGATFVDMCALATYAATGSCSPPGRWLELSCCVTHGSRVGFSGQPSCFRHVRRCTNEGRGM